MNKKFNSKIHNSTIENLMLRNVIKKMEEKEKKYKDHLKLQDEFIDLLQSEIELKDMLLKEMRERK